MGEYFKFVNVDKLRASPCMGKLSEYIWQPPALLIRLLHERRRWKGLEAFAKEASMVKYLPVTTEDGKKGRMNLLNLPFEIILMIFHALDFDFHDVIHFATAHRKLLVIGQKVLESVLNWSEPSWAGDRLFCVSDVWDIPKGVFSEQEEERFVELSGNRNPDLYQLPYKAWCITYDERRLAKLNALDYKRIERIIQLELAKPDVLCNHTKKIYVHKEKVESTELNSLRMVTLAHALLLKICCSAHLLSDLTLTRGEWAGDRFSVVDYEAFDEMLKNDKTWSDGTDALIKGVKEFQGVDVDSRLGFWKL